MKPPHARPDPRYLPPADPNLMDTRGEDTLASLLLIVAAMVLIFIFAFVLLPVLAS